MSDHQPSAIAQQGQQQQGDQAEAQLAPVGS
jgi:hypothetical protein